MAFGSCFTVASFTSTLRLKPELATPQASFTTTVELTAVLVSFTETKGNSKRVCFTFRDFTRSKDFGLEPGESQFSKNLLEINLAIVDPHCPNLRLFWSAVKDPDHRICLEKIATGQTHWGDCKSI